MLKPFVQGIAVDAVDEAVRVFLLIPIIDEDGMYQLIHIETVKRHGYAVPTERRYCRLLPYT